MSQVQPESEFRRLLSETEQRRIELLRTDLQICQTQVGLAEAELACKDYDHAAQTQARAVKSYNDVRCRFEQQQNWDETVKQEITEKLARLWRRLERLEKLLQPPSGT